MKTTFVLLILFLMTGCAAGSHSGSLPPAIARQTIRTAWQTEQHAVWQLEWPNAPLNGNLTVEVWRNETSQRLEILEAPAPGLWGQTLVFDGHTAWLFNRFEAVPPVIRPDAHLAPVTDAFNLIERLLNSPAQRATSEPVTILQHGSTQKITLFFNNDEQLTFWLLPNHNLPVRIVLTSKTNQFTLKATHVEKMITPLPGLFKPPVR